MDSATSVTNLWTPDHVSTDRFAYLASTAEQFANSADLSEGLDHAASGLLGCLDAAAVVILLLDDIGAGLTCKASAGALDLRGAKISLADDTVAECLRTNSIITRLHHQPRRFPSTNDPWNAIEVASIICAPMGIGVMPLGVICALNKNRGFGFQPDDQVFLRAASASISAAIYNTRLSEAIVDQDRTRRDLELAADIQRNLLPASNPAKSPVNGINRPARLVSGDFFDYMTLPDGTIPFTLGDVSGKGMNAALLMTKTASLFRCLAKSIEDPATLLKIMNREICETVSRGMFVTIVAGLYEPATGALRFANAGHEPPLLRAPDRSYQTFPADAPPIGILAEIEPETVEVGLDSGEFYIFTDGLTEFCYGEGEMLGVQGLIQMVEVAADASLALRLENVLSELDADGWEARDDLTVLTIDGAWVADHG